MKLRLTHKDLEGLTLDQKQNLCDLWIPHTYDVAVASVCVDAAEEKYEDITFVIGAIQMLKHHDMMLFDLKFLPEKDEQVTEEENSSDNIVSDRIDGISGVLEQEKDDTENSLVEENYEDTTQEEDAELDEDFSFELERPTSFVKADCIPLLDIGQMIDILERKNFGEGDFYLTATIGDFVCDIGKNEGANYDPNNVNSELCDVLWESIKAII